MLNINGVTPKIIRVEKDGITTDLNVLKINKNGVETAVWGKPFILSVLIGTNSSARIYRKSSPNAHASIGELDNGATIYYDDVLEISASASSGYTVQLLVNGNVQSNQIILTVKTGISVTTTARQTFVDPIIEYFIIGNYRAGEYDSSRPAQVTQLKIRNENDFAVSCVVTDNYNRTVFSTTIGAHNFYTHENVNYGDCSLSQVTIRVVFNGKTANAVTKSTTPQASPNTGSIDDETTTTA